MEKYYKNNRVRYTGNFVNGKEIGTFKYYSAASSEFPIAVRVYNKDNDVADVKFYSVTGVLESKGLMRGKNRVGKWIYFHENSKVVMAEENYVDGKLDGPYKTFYKSGKPTEIAFYKNGLLHGEYKNMQSKDIFTKTLIMKMVNLTVMPFITIEKRVN